MTPHPRSHRLARLSAACLAVATLTGCDEDAGPQPLPYSEPVTFATWNLGIARNFVPLAEARLPTAIETAAAIDADVLCLQEVWQDGDVAALLEAAADTFPHAWHVATDDSDVGPLPPPCTADELGPVRSCVEAACAETDDLAGCALDNCQDEIGALPRPCFDCLAANLASPLNVIFDTCTTRGSAFYEQGRNGLVLLSRTPLSDTGHLIMDSFLIRRTVLAARTTVAGVELDLGCTHVSAGLSEADYNGLFGSWAGEQLHQIDQLLEYMAGRGRGPAALMGDFNVSPGIATNPAGEVPGNFDRLLDAGWRAPYVDRDGRCTFCTSNTLADADTTDVLIDHVLLRGMPVEAAEAEVARFADETVTLESAGEEPVITHPSDHFGVSVTVGAAAAAP